MACGRHPGRTTPSNAEPTRDEEVLPRLQPEGIEHGRRDVLRARRGWRALRPLPTTSRAGPRASPPRARRSPQSSVALMPRPRGWRTSPVVAAALGERPPEVAVDIHQRLIQQRAGRVRLAGVRLISRQMRPTDSIAMRMKRCASSRPSRCACQQVKHARRAHVDDRHQVRTSA